ncbi:hypothetical protein D9M71_530930 [compost metagenome]
MHLHQQQALVVADTRVLRQFLGRCFQQRQRLVHLVTLHQQQGQHIGDVAVVGDGHILERHTITQHLLGFVLTQH